MKTKYDMLAIQPRVVASVVLDTPYTGREVTNPVRVSEIEARRQIMTSKERAGFIEDCDTICHAAHTIGAEWFEKIAKSKTSAGRDMLYSYVTHWLAAECCRLIERGSRENSMA